MEISKQGWQLKEAIGSMWALRENGNRVAYDISKRVREDGTTLIRME